MAPTTIKEAAQATEDYLVVSRPDYALGAMPVEVVKPTTQASTLEAGLQDMAEALVHQKVLLQQKLVRLEQKPARPQQSCFTSGEPHMKK